MEEIWKDIQGYDGDYQISNFGRVKSFKNNKERIIGKNNKPNNAGYIDIQLSKNSIIKHYRIHRLVAEYFLHKSDDNLVVDHVYGNKLNNEVDSLEWVTVSENHRRAIELGLIKTGSKASFSKSVYQYSLDGVFLKSWDCIREAADELNICRHNIATCCRGINYSYKGYRWSFNDKLNDRLITKCLNCEKEIEKTRSDKKYCNASCRGSYNKKLKT